MLNKVALLCCKSIFPLAGKPDIAYFQFDYSRTSWQFGWNKIVNTRIEYVFDFNVVLLWYELGTAVTIHTVPWNGFACMRCFGIYNRRIYCKIRRIIRIILQFNPIRFARSIAVCFSQSCSCFKSNFARNDSKRGECWLNQKLREMSLAHWATLGRCAKSDAGSSFVKMQTAIVMFKLFF